MLGIEPVKRLVAQGAQGGVGDGGQQRAQGGGMVDIPLQHMIRRGVAEARPAPASAGPPSAPLRAIAPGCAVSGAAARLQDRSAGAECLAGRITSVSPDKVRITRGTGRPERFQMQQRLGLKIGDVCGLGRVGQFQHIALARRGDLQVQIAFRGQPFQTRPTTPKCRRASSASSGIANYWRGRSQQICPAGSAAMAQNPASSRSIRADSIVLAACHLFDRDIFIGLVALAPSNPGRRSPWECPAGHQTARLRCRRPP